MLSDLLDRRCIQIGIQAHDFEDAIIKSAEPLKEYGYITQEYINKIVSIYQETGPYIVITKHVAMPHASSDAGALKMGLGVTVLAESVESGHESNDPVKYLFCLSAPDSESHLSLLSSLVNILSNESFYDEIAKVSSVDSVLEIIKKLEKEG